MSQAPCSFAERTPVTNRGRTAFTLIECLVAVSIIGLLVALLLPAIQAARESSRRAACANRLQQFGIALNAHATASGKFPSGILQEGIDPSTQRVASRGLLSVHAQLLPYFDNAVLYNALNTTVLNHHLNMSAATIRAMNATVNDTRINSFLCPSDVGAAGPCTNFRASVGPNPGEFDNSSSPGGGGAFPAFAALSPAEFPDGLANTSGFSERVLGSGRTAGFDRGRDLWFSGVSSLSPNPDAETLNRVCAASSADVSTFNSLGSRWNSAFYSDTLYNHVMTPSSTSMDCSADAATVNRSSISSCAVSARSWHSGRVNVLSMDGSVHSIGSGIALKVWRAMATRAGGEVEADGSY